MVKSLYENAKTVVVINGVISAPIQVVRGIHQGDSLSCLLFNLAIELLGNMLRKSNALQGFQIPGKEKHLKVTLSTDDTVVYLKQNDEIKKLFEILNEWCIVSGANFNMKKMVILPIGTPTYRQNVIVNRKSTPSGAEIDTNILIAKEKEPIQILGGWLGNGIDNEAIWSKNLDKIDEYFERWGRSNPTIFG